ncbi:PepSY-associated TM helix domain-containing protein [Adhaeribacter rhizoryzae]|uniref:PepSY domain-containing protein n=1 Tax=Adhaeribacter rhizoryzae TaxID=2607907 RepID=A0A5M6CZ79_9BACT|nr:PepSY-associated TM helix domain-containing protein [Adhaeribacter rhizoryzae]KAA5538619.1 PepSY domain-containing protein [Adhaeribacter rhizoryzae]
MSKINRISKLAFALHSWLGLVSGIFLLLLGLSGSALVFLEEIDHTINADLLRVQPEGTPLPLDTLYRKIGREHPHLAGMAWLNPEAKAEQAYEFRLYQNDGKLSTYDLGLISLNPYSGKVLREGNLKDLNPGIMHWLFQFHWSFQLGIPGLLLATVFGITMLLSIVTGLIIYRKFVWKVLLFGVKIKWDNWRTISSGLHRIVGVWALLFNVIIFFTGFWMNKFAMEPAYWQKQTLSSPANTLSSQSIDVMLLTAKKSMPDLIPNNVYLPTQPDKNFRVSGTVKHQSAFFYQGNSISIDPVSGQVLSTERLAEKGIWEKVEATFFPLHVGNFGGLPIKILYVIIGLLPGLLSCTGALLWWRKVKNQYRYKFS